MTLLKYNHAAQNEIAQQALQTAKMKLNRGLKMGYQLLS